MSKTVSSDSLKKFISVEENNTKKKQVYLNSTNQ
jgi:hypothetical protein